MSTIGEWDDFRAKADALSELIDEWQGVPIPQPDFALKLCRGHPLEGVFDKPVKQDDGPATHLRNRWYSWERQAWVWVFEEDGTPGKQHFVERVAPDRSMDRLNYWINTLAASVAWSHDAELAAREKLRAMTTPHAYRTYDLTGSFLEHSARSGVTYIFRRSRPTVAMIPSKRGDDDAYMKVLAVLCLHPIGYYEGTWAGAMVPTDDVIAHLVFMRGDERMFWRKANQHAPATPEAGL